jgi:RHS repeat-associated protein
VLFIQGSQTVGAVFGTGLEFYHLDVLGSVRMVTNMAGAVVKRHDYFAFGEDIAPMTGDPRRFTGKELDPETALQYFGARYYRNLWGRFTSVDPHDIIRFSAPAEIQDDGVGERGSS